MDYTLLKAILCPCGISFLTYSYTLPLQYILRSDNPEKIPDSADCTSGGGGHPSCAPGFFRTSGARGDANLTAFPQSPVSADFAASKPQRVTPTYIRPQYGNSTRGVGPSSVSTTTLQSSAEGEGLVDEGTLLSISREMRVRYKTLGDTILFILLSCKYLPPCYSTQ